MVRSNCPKPSTSARVVAGPFSPNRPSQRLNHRRYSPRAVAGLVTAAAVAPSFETAVRLLDQISDLAISPRHLQDLTHEVGGELAAARDRRTRQLRERPLNTPPRPAEPPLALAAVMTDGGRMQTRQPGSKTGVHQPHWRETKSAVLMRMTAAATGQDPHPALPRCFATAMAAPTTGAAAPTTAAPTTGAAAPTTGAAAAASPGRWGPKSLVRTGLATLADSEEFGWMLAAEADRRGFQSATRGAFVGDGQAYNWTIQRRHFATFTPILDFLHAAEYLHDAAKAAGDAPRGRTWAEACWQGRVAEVITDLERCQDALEPPPDPNAEPDAPWCVLETSRRYLENNRDKMDYPRYRREGLPITSSPIESWIKQLNQRVKGSDRFWEDGPRGEAILQVRAAWQGEDDALKNHLANRPGHPYSRPRSPASRAA